MMTDRKVLIKGAGDLASGIACRLFACGFQIVMTETAIPTTVRRTVAFSRAVYEGKADVENITGILCKTPEEIEKAVDSGHIAVVVDEKCETARSWKPDVIVDAIIAKKNLGTSIDDAKIVVGVGPGFTAGKDCHCVIETKRGHNLGRCIWEGSAEPNTGVPGLIGGYAKERLIKSPCDGTFYGMVSIGDSVKAGDMVGYVMTQEQEKKGVFVQIDGTIRGILQDGVKVTSGMKSGDVDPRDVRENCFTVSDKARSIGGGVLEAILSLENRRKAEH